jgi:hypothetical protein
MYRTFRAEFAFYPIAEFKRKVKEDHRFVSTVLEDKKIFPIGDQTTLDRLSG